MRFWSFSLRFFLLGLIFFEDFFFCLIFRFFLIFIFLGNVFFVNNLFFRRWYFVGKFLLLFFLGFSIIFSLFGEFMFLLELRWGFSLLIFFIGNCFFIFELEIFCFLVCLLIIFSDCLLLGNGVFFLVVGLFSVLYDIRIGLFCLRRLDLDILLNVNMFMVNIWLAVVGRYI